MTTSLREIDALTLANERERAAGMTAGIQNGYGTEGISFLLFRSCNCFEKGFMRNCHVNLRRTEFCCTNFQATIYCYSIIRNHVICNIDI